MYLPCRRRVNKEWIADDARVGRGFPEQLAGRRVERAEHPIVGAAGEHEPAAGRQASGPSSASSRTCGVQTACRCRRSTPALRRCVRAGRDSSVRRRAGEAAAGHVGAPARRRERRTEILVGRDVDHARLGLKAMGGQFLPPRSDGQNRRVLPVPGLLAGSTSGRPVFGSSCVKTFCLHERHALDEVDRAGRRVRGTTGSRCARR